MMDHEPFPPYENLLLIEPLSLCQSVPLPVTDADIALHRPCSARKGYDAGWPDVDKALEAWQKFCASSNSHENNMCL